MNEQNFVRFKKAYEQGLTEAVRKYPEEYDYPPEQAGIVAEKMFAAILKNHKQVMYINSRGFKNACSLVGIKYSQKAIFEFLGLTA